MSPEALVKNKESLDDGLFESIFFIIASKLRIFNAFKKAELEISFSTVKSFVKNLTLPSRLIRSSILFH